MLPLTLGFFFLCLFVNGRTYRAVYSPSDASAYDRDQQNQGCGGVSDKKWDCQGTRLTGLSDSVNVVQPGDAISIMVMGASGTGKSTFINLASGANHKVGDGLVSCTSQVTESRSFEVAGYKIILVDTPGFEHSSLSDADISEMIGSHVSTTYGEGFKPDAVIYMHRISDFKMSGVSSRNLKMLRELVSNESLDNVVIVTTMWGLVDQHVAEARERELMADERFFGPILDVGARMIRHDDTPESAQNIMAMIVTGLAHLEKDTAKPDATTELSRALAEVKEQQREDMAQIRREMAEMMAAKDEETKKELQRLRQELYANMETMSQDQARCSKELLLEQWELGERLSLVVEIMEDEMKEIDERLQAREEAFWALLGRIERIETPPLDSGHDFWY